MILLAPSAEQVARGEAPRAGLAEEQETVADIDDPWLRTGQVGRWTGDLDGMLDGMIERGFIRLLTTANRTDYFVDGAVEMGNIYKYYLAFRRLRDLDREQGRP